MPSKVETADDAVLEKIATMTQAIDPDWTAEAAAQQALAVLRLAEAHAWLRSVAQSHGGSAAGA